MFIITKRKIYFVFTILMMIIIFLFSSQESKNSNYLSYSISNFIFEIIESKEVSSKANVNNKQIDEEVSHTNAIEDIRENNQILEESLTNNSVKKNDNSKKTAEDVFPIENKTFYNINFVVRKSAHVFLYMMLGIFVISYMKKFNISTKKAILLTILFCFMVACLDEFNQYLRGTRTAKFTDSLIDASGCILGCLIVGIKEKVVKKY